MTAETIEQTALRIAREVKGEHGDLNIQIVEFARRLLAARAEPGVHDVDEFYRDEPASPAQEAPAAPDATPETDAYVLTRTPSEADEELGLNPYRSMSADIADFARSLERQRNALRDKLSVAERDAKRYRWLREGLTMTEGRLKAWAKGKQLDAAIDAAPPAQEAPAAPRREGHSALRVKNGTIETFDPHPAQDATPDMSAEECRVVARIGSYPECSKQLFVAADRIDDLTGQRNALRDKLSVAERDAKRYRWLRDSNKHTHYGHSHVGGSTPSQRLLMAINGDPRYFECITSEIPLAHVPEGGELIWKDGGHFDFAANMDAAIDAAMKEPTK